MTHFISAFFYYFISIATYITDPETRVHFLDLLQEDFMNFEVLNYTLLRKTSIKNGVPNWDERNN